MPINTEEDSVQTAIEKLKAKEQTLMKLESMAKLGSWEIDVATGQTIWSDQSYINYGYNIGEVQPSVEFLLSRIVPEEVAKVQKGLHDLANGQHVTLETLFQRKDNSVINLLINAQAIFNDDGSPLKFIGTTQDITEINELKNQTLELSNILEYSTYEIYIVDYHTLTYMFVNKGACDELGYTKEELYAMDIFDINPYLTNLRVKMLKTVAEKNGSVINRSVHKRSDGSLYHVHSFIQTLTFQGKDAYVIFDTDISQTVMLEQKMKKQAKILEHIHDGVIATNLDGEILAWNAGAQKLLGYTEDEVLEEHFSIFYDENANRTFNELLDIIRNYGEYDFESYLQKKDGTQVICDIALSPMMDEKNEVSGLIGYCQNITDKKETQKLLMQQALQLNHQANHDALTGLPNRTLFKDRLGQAIIQYERNSEQFALFFIDLDQFKKVNDSLGHHIGDEVLMQAANRIRSAIRAEDTLSRLGGDEFTVIVKELKDSASASKVAQKIIDVMRTPIHINGHTLYISTSIGISLYPQDAKTENDLLKYADTAMYKAKDEGRDNYQFYSSDMTVLAFEQVVMETSLRIAIKEEQFVVYFQPQYNAITHDIIGMEALVRWQHPQLGLIPPGKFIPIAEENGLITEIDRIVMYKAMKQFVEWYQAGLKPGKLSLNLAMKQLNSEDFLNKLFETMDQLNFNPFWLELEITEGDVMKNPETSIKKLKRLSELGIELAIDDFGTGYSSLSYLKKLPLDKLKIDQSFIKELPLDDEDAAITKAIIALGNSLSLKLIAEGVETDEQRSFLLEHECHHIQGFLYSRPIPPEDILQMLQKIS